MRYARFAVAALVAAALGSSGCVKSLTEESDTGYLSVSGTLANASESPTLVSFECFVDGQKITGNPPAGSPRAVATLYGMKFSAGRGGHRLEIRVVDQTESPSTYRFSKMIVAHHFYTGLFSSKEDARTALPDVTISLESGASAVWDFRI